MPSGGSQLSNKIGVSRKIQLACGMPLFNFGFLKPIKKPAPVHHEDDEDSGDEIVHGPV